MSKENNSAIGDEIEGLELCPFCGGSPTRREMLIYTGAQDDGHYIECSQCGSRTKVVYGGEDELWNTRYSQRSEQQDGEKLIEATAPCYSQTAIPQDSSVSADEREQTAQQILGALNARYGFATQAEMEDRDVEMVVGIMKKGMPGGGEV